MCTWCPEKPEEDVKSLSVKAASALNCRTIFSKPTLTFLNFYRKDLKVKIPIYIAPVICLYLSVL